MQFHDGLLPVVQKLIVFCDFQLVESIECGTFAHLFSMRTAATALYHITAWLRRFLAYRSGGIPRS